ncbi:MAG: hypothetical protein KDB21_07245 [Acidimicrobiales bacterium]|nr:hypothetical protein [Acidimicrobiales bacterium]
MTWLVTEIAALLVGALVLGVVLGWLLSRLIGRLRRSPESAGGDLTDVRTERDTLRMEAEGLRTDIEALRSGNEDLSARHRDLSATIDTLTEERASLAGRVGELQVALDDERREIADQLANRAALGSNDSTDADADGLRTQLDACRAELATTRRVLAERTEQLSIARHEIAECAARDEELAAVTDELQELRDRQPPISPWVTDAAPDPAEITAALADLEARSQRHEELLARLAETGDAAAPARQVDVLQERIASLEQAVGERNEEIVRLSTALGAEAPKRDGDDLTRLPGVDDVVADGLAVRGITRFKHVARLAPRDLEDVLAGIDGAPDGLDADHIIRRANRLHRASRGL